MKTVPITFLVTGTFYSKGKKYKTGGCIGTRILCSEVDNPKNEMQFSSYGYVEVDDEDAEKVMTFMQDILRSTECRLSEIKDGIKLLESQGVASTS